MQSLKGKSGIHILVANSTEDVQKNIISLLGDKDLCEKIGLNGQKLVQEEYSWEAHVKKVLTVYQNGEKK